MRKLLLLFALFLLLFGCIHEVTLDTIKKEKISRVDRLDIDKDGQTDLWIFVYQPHSFSSVSVKRILVSWAKYSVSYDYLNPLSENESLQAKELLGEFELSRKREESFCSGKLGLSEVTCVDIPTCERICKSKSPSCSRLADEESPGLGDSILKYASLQTDISNAMEILKLDIPVLTTLSDNEVQTLAININSIRNAIVSLSANNIYLSHGYSFCPQTDYGLSYLMRIMDLLGTYTTKVSSYNYRVLFLVTGKETEGNLKNEIEVIERLPQSVIKYGYNTPFSVSEVANNRGTLLVFPSFRFIPYGKKIFYYDFESKSPPEEIANTFLEPKLIFRQYDMSFFAPVIFLNSLFTQQLGNSIMPTAWGFGLILSFLLFIIFVFHILFAFVLSLLKKKDFGYFIKKVFGKTRILWKKSLLIGFALLISSFIVNYVLQVKFYEQTNIIEIFNKSMSDINSFVIFVLSFFSVLFIYTGLENKTRLMLLEKFYGRYIRGEKDLLLSSYGQLNDRYSELKELIIEMERAGFDVESEKSMLSSISLTPIYDAIVRGDPSVRERIEKTLAMVELNLDRLKEKEEAAEEYWPMWEKEIMSVLSNVEEAPFSRFSSIPVFYRLWALRRFAKEHPEIEMTITRTGVKRKEIKPEKRMELLMKKSMLFNSVFIENDELKKADISVGKKSVFLFSFFKIRQLIPSISNSLGLRPLSFTAVGKKYVFLYIPGLKEKCICMPKEKFRDVINIIREGRL